MHTRPHPRIPAHTTVVAEVTVVVAFWTDQSCVNRPNTKKADRKKEDRKRKEQESAEAFSGLKNDFNLTFSVFITNLTLERPAAPTFDIGMTSYIF